MRTSSSASSTPGITPESLSFTDRKIKKDKLGKVVYEQVPLGAPPAGWAGTCQTGEAWTASDCNNKLIGARYFNAGQGGNAGIDTNRPWEFISPRDYNGHGTHTVVDLRRQLRRPGDGCRRRVRQGQRHGASGARRVYKALLVDAGLVDRERQRRRSASPPSTRPSPTAST